MKKDLTILLIIFLISSMVVSASHLANKATKQIYEPYRINYTSTSNGPFNQNQLPKNSNIVFYDRLEIFLDICFETDYGRDYYNQGTAYFFPNPSIHCQNEITGALKSCRLLPKIDCFQYISDECRPRSEADRCINNTVLNEAYCDNGRLRHIWHRCKNGCYNGACF